MSLYYSTSGLHNPELSLPLPQHMLYPVAQRTGQGLDLDYSSIMVSRFLVMDEAMYGFLVSDTSPGFLAPMRRTLKELRAAELLFLDDFDRIIRQEYSGISERITALLDDPYPWFRIARSQWNSLRHELREFQATFGDANSGALNTGHMGVESWLAKTGRADDDASRQQLYDVLEGRFSARRLPIDELRGTMRFIVSQVVISDLIGNRTRLALLNWQDSQPYYDRLYSTRWGNEVAEGNVIAQAGVLFDVVAPELRPNNVAELIKFVRDGRSVGALRDQILSVIEAGKSIDAAWMKDYANEAVRRDIAARDRLRIFRWLGTGAGLVPGLDWGVGVAIDSAVGAVDTIAGRPKADLRWYYALQRTAARRKKQ